MAETALEHPLAQGPSGPRTEIVVHVDADVLTAPDPDPATSVSLGTARCHLQDGPGLMPQIARQLACDGGVVLAVRGQGRAPAPVLTSGDAAVARTRRSFAHYGSATKAASIPAAADAVACTLTTSSTGCTAARPHYTNLCCSAATTTGARCLLRAPIGARRCSSPSPRATRGRRSSSRCPSRLRLPEPAPAGYLTATMSIGLMLGSAASRSPPT